MRSKRALIQKILGILQMTYAVFIILFGGTILYGNALKEGAQPNSVTVIMSIFIIAIGVALVIIGDRISGSILGENDENNYGTFKEIMTIILNLAFILLSALCFVIGAELVFNALYVLAYIPALPIIGLAVASILIKRSEG